MSTKHRTEYSVRRNVDETTSGFGSAAEISTAPGLAQPKDFLPVKDGVFDAALAALCAERTWAAEVKFEYTGGDRGWKGDVPLVRFDTAKLRARGWSNRLTSRDAMCDAIDSMIRDPRTGRFDGGH